MRRQTRLIATAVGGSTPKLWGSRVIGKEEGGTGVMDFDYVGSSGIILNEAKGTHNKFLHIENGYCKVDGKTIGSPCESKNGNARITIDDPSTYKRMSVYHDAGDHTVLFVPGCKFPTPEKDRVVPELSLPLSRFEKGYSYVSIVFAVKGANTQVTSNLILNGEILCIWKGASLTESHSNECAPLRVDIANDRVEFCGIFPKTDTKLKDIFRWLTDKDYLSISVDWEQSGESPNDENCRQNPPQLLS